MQRFEIRLLLDELKEYILSFLPVHEIFFTVSKVSKQFQHFCNELLLHEYNKVRIEQFNQSPITSQLFTSSERLKFVKFTLRNLIYQYATFIVKNFNGCFNDHELYQRIPPPPFKFLHKAEIDFIELSSIFNNFHDLPNRSDNKIEKGFFSKIVSSVFKTKTSKFDLEGLKMSELYWIGDREYIEQFKQCLFFVKTDKYHRGPPFGRFSILNFGMECAQSNSINGKRANFYIHLQNPYSNTLEDVTNNIKVIDIILVTTTMKDLKTNQSRMFSQEEANWFAYQNYNGSLHRSIRNITVSELGDLLIISLYCSVLKFILANHPFDYSNSYDDGPLYPSTVKKN